MEMKGHQNEVHYKHLAYFFYQKGKSPSQTAKKICAVYGERSVAELTIKKWFAQFNSRHFNPVSLEGLDSPSIKSKKKIIAPNIDKANNVERVTNFDVYDKIKADFSVDLVCGWLTNDPLYIAYHDEEWGKPEYDSIRLFEMICLEGQQAGLSWLTILKKRDHYRKLFYNFDPHKVAQLKSSDINKYLDDPGIVRHRSKIEAILNNAKCYIQMENNNENFSEFIWGFVNNSPIVNDWKNDEVPIQTDTSTALSKALKKRGFKFVGSTTCYAFMQACGLVNDHLTSCYVRIDKH